MFQFPRIPTRTGTGLSPIQEETEEVLRALTPGGIQGTSDSKPAIEQRNNNSPHRFDSDMSGASKSEENSKLRKVSSTETNYIYDVTSSRSYRETRRFPEPARRPEVEVEVLKQTYLNQYIQDIPSGFPNGPVRFGRLHRSRSQHNTVSQDIRRNMKILRSRSGINTTGLSPKMQFRCSRFAADAEKLTGKTLEELLSVDALPDDYDPELARLFDDYVEACDQITRGDFTSDTALLRRSADRQESSVSKPVDSETKEAFWRGFMEGMSHSKHTHPGESDDLDLAVTSHDDQREATQDPCIDKTNHSDMIRNNQDITHKFLKEWESLHSATDTDGNGKDSACFACNTEHTLLNDLLINKPDGIVHINTERDVLCIDDTEAEKDKSKNETASQQIGLAPSQTTNQDGHIKRQHGNNEPREIKSGCSATPVFKATNRVLPAIGVEGTQHDISDAKQNGPKKKCAQPEKRPVRSIKKSTAPSAISSAGPFMTVNMDNYTVNERNQSRSSSRTASRGTTVYKEEHTRDDGGLAPRQEKAVDKLTRVKDVFDEEVFREYAFRDENINIIALAKMKLENKCMSSLALDNALRLRSESRRSQTPRCRSEEPDRNHEGMMMRNVIRDMDLDGWDAKTKPFCEQDNLHMSTSELLHPVDSAESFFSPSPWRQAKSTPLLTSIDKKYNVAHFKDQTSIRVMTPDRGTPTSAILSDLDGSCTPRRKFETSAFKPNNNAAKNKLVERVKLRLTKSCDNFVAKDGHYKDSAFTNIPLAPCLSYSIEKKMKTSLPIASSINLSESLARQLKQLGKDKDVNGPRAYIDRNQDQKQDDATSSVEFETVQTRKNVQTIDSKRTAEKTPGSHQTIKPEEPTLPKIENNSVNLTQEKVLDENLKEEPVPRNQSLPPISGTSLLAPKTHMAPGKLSSDIPLLHQSRLLHCDEESELWMNRSIPCRAESMQTPYTFDRADPSKLLLRTRALPHLHSVCTSCGGINKRHENTSGHEKPGLQGTAGKGKATNVHHRCVTPGNDEKWKLETPVTETPQQFPQIGVSKFPNRNLDQSNKPVELKKEICTNNYSKYERTKKSQNDEMTFRFLDQNIKLRFEVDMKNEDKPDFIESLHGPNHGLSPRLLDISKPNRRDELESPITRETRIYKEKNRQKRLLLNGDKGRTEGPPASPYLEYCKRRAHLQCMKETSVLDNCVDMIQDVGVSHKQPGSRTRKRFPVIQAKTNKDVTKKNQRVSAKHNKSQKAKSEKDDSIIGGQDLTVEPGVLPVVCQLSPRRDKQKRKTVPQKEGASVKAKKQLLPSIEDKHRVSVDLMPRDDENNL